MLNPDHRPLNQAPGPDPGYWRGLINGIGIMMAIGVILWIVLWL